MKNYVGPGKSVDYTAGANIASGDVVVANDLIGIAVTDIANGKTGAIYLEGEFEVKKEASLAINFGDKVYWDSVAKEADKTNTNKVLGYCTKAALAADATVVVKLFPF